MSSRPCGAGAEADADRMADAGADDAVGAEQPDRAVVEMHGAAAPAADSRRALPKSSAIRTLRVDALGERVPVAAVGRGDPVGRP